MDFILGRKTTMENAIVRKMYFDEKFLQVVSEDPHGLSDHPEMANGEPAGCITWYLQTLKGRDSKKIQDEMVEMNTKDSSARMRTGTATESRIIASVFHVDGLVWEHGTKAETMKKNVFADLETWQINQLGEWVDEINQDSDKAKAVEKSE